MPLNCAQTESWIAYSNSTIWCTVRPQLFAYSLLMLQFLVHNPLLLQQDRSATSLLVYQARPSLRVSERCSGSVRLLALEEEDTTCQARHIMRVSHCQVLSEYSSISSTWSSHSTTVWVYALLKTYTCLVKFPNSYTCRMPEYTCLWYLGVWIGYQAPKTDCYDK